jgi:hypothetical protein
MPRPVIALVTSEGRLVSFSNNPDLVREVAEAMLEDLPPEEDTDSPEIADARRRVLVQIAAGGAGE